MSSKTPLERLALLAPHWAEHTREHIDEMGEWLAVAAAAGPEAEAALADAMAALRDSVEALARLENAVTPGKG